MAMLCRKDMQVSRSCLLLYTKTSLTTLAETTAESFAAALFLPRLARFVFLPASSSLSSSVPDASRIRLDLDEADLRPARSSRSSSQSTRFCTSSSVVVRWEKMSATTSRLSRAATRSSRKNRGTTISAGLRPTKTLCHFLKGIGPAAQTTTQMLCRSAKKV